LVSSQEDSADVSLLDFSFFSVSKTLTNQKKT